MCTRTVYGYAVVVKNRVVEVFFDRDQAITFRDSKYPQSGVITRIPYYGNYYADPI